MKCVLKKFDGKLMVALENGTTFFKEKNGAFFDELNHVVPENHAIIGVFENPVDWFVTLIDMFDLTPLAKVPDYKDRYGKLSACIVLGGKHHDIYPFDVSA